MTNICDKIKNLRSMHKFQLENSTLKRCLLNVHKRILLLLRHAEVSQVNRANELIFKGASCDGG